MPKEEGIFFQREFAFHHAATDPKKSDHELVTIFQALMDRSCKYKKKDLSDPPVQKKTSRSNDHFWEVEG